MFIDNEVIRFKNGVNNRSQGDIFNSMPVPDRTAFSEYCNDFLSFNTVVPGAQPDQVLEGVWNIGTLFGTASAGSVAYFGGTQGLQGKLLCQTGATLNDDLNFNFGCPAMTFGRNRKAFFKVIFALENADTPFISVGCRNGGTPLVPQSGAWWQKPAGANPFDFHIARFGVTEQAGLTNQPPLVNDDDIELSLYFDGEDGLWGGINGTALGRIQLTDANFPYNDGAGNMTPFVYIQNGAASAQRIDLDFIYWAQERSQAGIEL